MSGIPLSDENDEDATKNQTLLFRRKSVSKEFEFDRRFVDWRKGFLTLALMSAPLPTKHQKDEYINLITKDDGSLMQSVEFVKVSKIF